MRRCVVWMGLMLGVLAGVPGVQAQALPPVDPSGTVRQDHVMAYDRSTPPGDIVLFPRRTLLGYSEDLGRRYGAIHLTCRSASDSAQGRCPMSADDANGAGETRIPLRFVERRSGTRTDVMVTGSLQRAYTSRRCFGDLWNDVDRPLSTTFSSLCLSDPAAGTGVWLRIAASELAMLVAGHWDAELTLDLRVDGNGAALATYVFGLELTITDHDAVAIYFPAFEGITPHLGLNLRYDPISQQVGGHALLDMCLYDGLGSQAEYLAVTVRDSGPRPPDGTGYSAWHQDGGSAPAQRLDYTVFLEYAGARLAMANNVEQQLRGIDSTQLRAVVLPGMSQMVFCVPAPLTLETPPVSISSKRAGYYRGDLQVELRVPASRP